MKYFIYKIVNSIDDKVYVGSTINLKQRWKCHIYDLRRKNGPLQRHIREQGINKFEIILVKEIDVFTKTAARHEEQLEINKYEEDQLLNGQKALLTKQQRALDHGLTEKLRYQRIKTAKTK
jgi:group I intron endonuclease